MPNADALARSNADALARLLKKPGRRQLSSKEIIRTGSEYEKLRAAGLTDREACKELVERPGESINSRGAVQHRVRLYQEKKALALAIGRPVVASIEQVVASARARAANARATAAAFRHAVGFISPKRRIY